MANSWRDQDATIATWHAGIGLGAGHIVLDGDLPPPKRGHSLPIFGHVWPNGLMDEDATWEAYGAIGIGPRDIV